MIFKYLKIICNNNDTSVFWYKLNCIETSFNLKKKNVWKIGCKCKIRKIKYYNKCKQNLILFNAFQVILKDTEDNLIK